MAKPRATGADAVVMIAKEVTPGTPVSGAGGGVYRRLPFRSNTLDASQPLEDDPTWNIGTTDDGDPSLGAFDVSGDLVTPMDLRSSGFALGMVLGASTTVNNGDGTYTHTWKSGKELSYWSVQKGFPTLTTPKWRTSAGCKAGGFSFPMDRSGRALMTIPIIGMKQIKDVAGARDASPLLHDYVPFDNASGAVKVAGNALANVTGGQFNFTNNLDPVTSIREDMSIDGADEQKRSASGSVTLRFGADATIDDLVDAKTPAALELSFKLIAQPTRALKVLLPRVFFELAKKPIEGPGGISAQVNFRAAYDPTSTYMMAVTLLNDVVSYAG